MSIGIWRELREIREILENMEERMTRLEQGAGVDLTPFSEEIRKINGEIRAMKARMGKNAKTQ